MCILVKTNNSPQTFRLLKPFLDKYLEKTNNEQGDIDTLLFSYSDKIKDRGVYLAVDEKRNKIVGYLLLGAGLEPESIIVIQSGIESGYGKSVYKALFAFCKKHRYNKIQWITNRKDGNEQIWNKTLQATGIKRRANIMEVSI